MKKFNKVDSFFSFLFAFFLLLSCFEKGESKEVEYIYCGPIYLLPKDIFLESNRIRVQTQDGLFQTSTLYSDDEGLYCLDILRREVEKEQEEIEEEFLEEFSENDQDFQKEIYEVEADEDPMSLDPIFSDEQEEPLLEKEEKKTASKNNHQKKNKKRKKKKLKAKTNPPNLVKKSPKKKWPYVRKRRAAH